MSLALLIFAVIILVLSYALAENGLGQVQIGIFILVTVVIGVNSIFDASASTLSSMLVFISCLLVLFSVALRYFLARPQKEIDFGVANFHYDLLFFSFPFAMLLVIFGLEIIHGNWTEFRKVREESPVTLMLSTCLFFIGTGRLLSIPKQWRYLPRVVVGSVFLFTFVVITREKIFLVPILLASFFDLNFRRISMKQSLLLAVVFFMLYFISTAIRWYGSFDEGFKIEQFLAVTIRAIDAGFERFTYVQYTSVMNYFHSSEHLGLVSVLRLLLLPFDKLLGTELAPNNPMYLYAEISQTAENVLRSSAHPTMYGDFYGQIGLLMIAIPSIIYLIVIKTGSIIQNKKGAYVLAAGLFIFMALIVRGSSYYGLMYHALGFVLMGLLNFGRIFRIRAPK